MTFISRRNLLKVAAACLFGGSVVRPTKSPASDLVETTRLCYTATIQLDDVVVVNRTELTLAIDRYCRGLERYLVLKGFTQRPLRQSTTTVWRHDGHEGCIGSSS